MHYAAGPKDVVPVVDVAKALQINKERLLGTARKVVQMTSSRQKFGQLLPQDALLWGTPWEGVVLVRQALR
jgi:hypothetical protein